MIRHQTMEQDVITLIAEQIYKTHSPKYLRWGDNGELLPKQIVRRGVRRRIVDAGRGREIENIGSV